MGKKPVAKRIAKALNAENYNILQNNGRIAHQEVDHVHFHVVRLSHSFLVISWSFLAAEAEAAEAAAAAAVLCRVMSALADSPINEVYSTNSKLQQIPKPNEKEGLGVGWPAQKTDMEALKSFYESVKAKI